MVLGIEFGTSLMVGRHLTPSNCKMYLLLRFGGDGGGIDVMVMAVAEVMASVTVIKHGTSAHDRQARYC